MQRVCSSLIDSNYENINKDLSEGEHLPKISGKDWSPENKMIQETSSSQLPEESFIKLENHYEDSPSGIAEVDGYSDYFQCQKLEEADEVNNSKHLEIADIENGEEYQSCNVKKEKYDTDSFLASTDTEDLRTMEHGTGNTIYNKDVSHATCTLSETCVNGVQCVQVRVKEEVCPILAKGSK